MPKGYGTLTIIDLLDTATYIYYADDPEGSNPSVTPDGKFYIGIYSGPALSTQPEVGTDEYNTISEEIEWSRYVGDGFGPPTYRYAQNQDGENPPSADATDTWQLKPFAPDPGQYLWTEQTLPYLDVTKDPIVSYSVSYSGEDANYYVVEMSTDEVVKFITEEESLNFSPTQISFEVHDTRNESTLVNLDNWTLKISFFYGPGYLVSLEISDTVFEKYYIVDEKDEAQIDQNAIHKRYINLSSLLSSNAVNLAGQEILKTQEGVFRIELTPPDELDIFPIIEVINFRYGITSDLATFNIHASGFNSAIDSSQLSFGRDGLELKNATITSTKTIDGIETIVFRVDKNGNASFAGDITGATGTFSGRLEALEGFFHGAIQATEGTIGGFTIANGALYSGQQIENSPLILYGTEGKIKADNIELGSYAQITDYIRLGNAYLRNPDKDDYHRILESKNIYLTDNGEFKVGKIYLDGSSDVGSIYAAKTDNPLTNNDYNWKIDGNGTAIFNDIYADNVHLSNTILEVGTVQNVGSLMLFKDTYSVDKVEVKNDVTVLTINGSTSLKVNDWIFVGNSVYQIDTVNYTDLITTIALKTIASDITNQSIITRFGQTETDYILSALGQANLNDNNLWDFARGNSITISGFKPGKIGVNGANDALTYDVRLLMGSLESIKAGAGFGFYADNVLLNGSLTTTTETTNGKSYAGVNTLNGVTANIFSQNSSSLEPDNTPIVFWAGSKSDNDWAIKDAPFQVTERGSLYARQGLFEGSIITNSTIQASKLIASEIHGDGENSPLKIYDANYGISFYDSLGTSQDISDDIEVLKITSKGMVASNLEFIQINRDKNSKIANQIIFQGNQFLGDIFRAQNGNNIVRLDGINGLTFRSGSVDQAEGQVLAQLNFVNNNFEIKTSNEAELTISEGKTNIGNIKTIDRINKEIIFGEEKSGQKRMVYKQKTNGFDLFIR